MRSVQVRRWRLAAAFVLLTYVVLHFLNHSLGLISLAAMEAGRWWFLALWRSAPGTVALYGAISVHGGLALWLLYQRRSLRMPRWEAAQYTLGLLIPALLAVHVTATRMAWWRVGADDPYARIVLGLWVLSPDYGWRQVLAVSVVWLHACIGIHYWLRFRPWYPRFALALFAGALLLPVLALLGFVSAGHEVARLAQTPGWTPALLARTHAPGPAESARLLLIRQHFLNAYLLALVAVLVARGVRHLRERRRSIHVVYTSGRVVAAPLGFSILEASRLGGVPHASVCGGRGRCSRDGGCAEASTKSMCRHSRARRRREPAIHNRGPWSWIPGSLATLGPRNDGPAISCPLRHLAHSAGRRPLPSRAGSRVP